MNVTARHVRRHHVVVPAPRVEAPGWVRRPWWDTGSAGLWFAVLVACLVLMVVAAVWWGAAT